jgi:hypothetical protein
MGILRVRIDIFRLQKLRGMQACRRCEGIWLRLQKILLKRIEMAVLWTMLGYEPITRVCSDMRRAYSGAPRLHQEHKREWQLVNTNRFDSATRYWIKRNRKKTMCSGAFSTILQILINCLWQICIMDTT